MDGNVKRVALRAESPTVWKTMVMSMNSLPCIFEKKRCANMVEKAQGWSFFFVFVGLNFCQMLAILLMKASCGRGCCTVCIIAAMWCSELLASWIVRWTSLRAWILKFHQLSMTVGKCAFFFIKALLGCVHFNFD